MRRLWNVQITYDGDKDKWFLVGLGCGIVGTLMVMGIVLGWWAA